jgi:hypothetical protein
MMSMMNVVTAADLKDDVGPTNVCTLTQITLIAATRHQGLPPFLRMYMRG